MENNPLISVIVPVFNLEKYVERSIKSILAQTYENIEVLICDDCSVDSTISVCKKMAAADPRVRLLRNESNAGVSVSRNRCLDIARGRYIMFVDGDDVLSRDAVESLITHCEDDVVLCEAKMVVVYEQNITSDDKAIRVCSNSCDDYLKPFLKWKTSLSCCAKLFKKEAIAELRFAPGFKVNEDRLFLYEFLTRNKDRRIITLGKTVYGVLERKGSACRGGFSLKYKDMYHISELILVESRGSDHYKEAVFNDVVTNLMFLKYILRSKKYNDYRSLFNERRSYLLRVTRSEKVKYGARAFEIILLKIGTPVFSVYVTLVTKMLRRPTY